MESPTNFSEDFDSNQYGGRRFAFLRGASETPMSIVLAVRATVSVKRVRNVDTFVLCRRFLRTTVVRRVREGPNRRRTVVVPRPSITFVTRLAPGVGIPAMTPTVVGHRVPLRVSSITVVMKSRKYAGVPSLGSSPSCGRLRVVSGVAPH